MKQLLIPWFLWSIVYPGGSYMEKDIVAQPVKEFESQDKCEKGLIEYRKEVDKAYPPQRESGFAMSPWVQLKCSPIYPR